MNLDLSCVCECGEVFFSSESYKKSFGIKGAHMAPILTQIMQKMSQMYVCKDGHHRADKTKHSQTRYI